MILCIDDEPIGLRIRKILLETEGYNVVTATSGQEGLQIFAQSPIKAVVLDYSMPGMNGGEVAAELKRLNPQIPILLLSAYVELPEEALRWVDSRAQKGESPLYFLEAVKQLFSPEMRMSNPATG